MAFSLLDSETLPGGTGGTAIRRYDSTRLVVGSYNMPSVGPTVSAYSWDGSAFSFIDTASFSGSTTTGNMLVSGSNVYLQFTENFTAGGAGVARFTFDGSTVSYMSNNCYFPGRFFPGDYRGAVYGWDFDGTYLYVCGLYINYVGFVTYNYALRCYTPTLTLQGSALNLSSFANTGGIISQGGSIYLYRSGTAKRYTFNGSVFSLQSTFTDPGFITSARDGTHFFVKNSDGHTIDVLDNSLATLTSFDTTYSTITDITYSNGYVLVTFSGSILRVYSFDGANFSLVGEGSSVGYVTA